MSIANQAERFRRARSEFEQAMAIGCTIVELRRGKRALAHRAQVEVADHTANLMTREMLAPTEEQAPHFWWLKD
ncbi:hypothetical protein [Sphingobium yanoikuyae]|uniref:Uncharacterized protein n=1 Tax=Sphingobium yanoikuyae TaxID=13690 RepID=A0A430BX46_SPHYA|nr:hypothetical protein [Sphingobium yanoikuyae]RSU57223.1 hypothetical protein DAH51_10445 [Sphingobium yanoikuyae]